MLLTYEIKKTEKLMVGARFMVRLTHHPEPVEGSSPRVAYHAIGRSLPAKDWQAGAFGGNAILIENRYPYQTFPIVKVL